MRSFFGRPRYEHQLPPREPSRRELTVEDRIRDLDIRIYCHHRMHDHELADALLDKRNRIRPPRVRDVPVIPGRAS